MTACLTETESRIFRVQGIAGFPVKANFNITVSEQELFGLVAIIKDAIS
jgi:hypothetical protein